MAANNNPNPKWPPTKIDEMHESVDAGLDKDDPANKFMKKDMVVEG